jgi:small conductance mechanosensitive channel
MQAPPSPAAVPPDNTIEIVAALGFAAVLSAAIALIAAGLVRRFVASVEGHTEKALTEPLRQAPVRLVGFGTFVVSMVALTFPALAMVNVGLPGELEAGEIGWWIARTAMRIGIITIVALMANRIVGAIITRAQSEIAGGAGAPDVERQKRAETIGRTFRGFLSAVIGSTALLMILRTLDVDITPVLTGAGILGLAVGFGAQTLVKDMITGFFVILEDQVRVGDVALINGIGGVVEQINLRTIVLRDLEGTVHVVPNGEIRTLANRSKDFSFYLVDLAVDYADDVDAAIDVVREAAAELQRDPAFAAHILAPVEILGVDDFNSTALVLRFRIKTLPLSQWLVGRELRRRIKLAFDRAGLRLPVQRVEVSARK